MKKNNRESIIGKVIAKLRGMGTFMLVTFAVSLPALAEPTAQSQRVIHQQLKTDVIDIQAEHLTAKYWLNKLPAPDKVLMSQQEISAFNQTLVNTNPYITDPLAIKPVLTKSLLLGKINQISSIPSSARHFANKTPLTESDYQELRDKVNLAAITEANSVAYGLVTRRSVLRKFPTWQRAFKLNDDDTIDHELDLFQESGIFPGEVVAVLHNSKDGLWSLVQAYNYLAWMPSKDLAIGEKDQIAQFNKAAHFITITGGKVFVDIPRNAQNNEAELLQLDMGVRLPLVTHLELSLNDSSNNDSLYNVNGQNPYANHIVRFPTKNSFGKLAFTTLSIPKSKDVTVGTLAMTQGNIIKQSFKFLGERYGWGHDFNGRDCTGFIGEIYKSFGLLMPRNSGQQAKSDYGYNIRFQMPINEQLQAKSKHEQDTLIELQYKKKQQGLESLQVGDLLYLPGHVVMFLGMDKGQPYIIHDVKDYKVLQENGQLYEGVLNGVSVTPLQPMHDYVNQLSVIKRLAYSTSQGDLSHNNH
ncbi:SH3 domain-containing protein [Litorilituus lipolyticus]|uniref:SH3 domain-containing protein n=1 Tax=Litorilituus lipolyticus TaxID=2491017 RepID=UPI00147909E7|nr:SH3 domain-containing protein [Litorilituus lipolyticus]